MLVNPCEKDIAVDINEGCPVLLWEYSGDTWDMGYSCARELSEVIIPGGGSIEVERDLGSADPGTWSFQALFSTDPTRVSASGAFEVL